MNNNHKISEAGCVCVMTELVCLQYLKHSLCTEAINISNVYIAPMAPVVSGRELSLYTISNNKDVLHNITVIKHLSVICL